MKWSMAIVGLMTAATLALADGEKKQPIDVQEFEVKVLGKTMPRGGQMNKPTVIDSKNALAEKIPDADLRNKIIASVDFGKQALVFFAWSGSGQDKVEASSEDRPTGPVVVFSHRRGLTRDLRAHYRLYAIPKDAKWVVEELKRK